MHFLGIDPGGKRLGLALGDDVTGLASPLEVVPYEGRNHAARLIAEAIERYGAQRVVIGLPTSSDGSQTPGCARSHALAAVVSALGIEVALQREYLTTDEARRRARTSGRKPGQPVDDIAAQVILEEYLEGRRTRGATR